MLCWLRPEHPRIATAISNVEDDFFTFAPTSAATRSSKSLENVWSRFLQRYSNCVRPPVDSQSTRRPASPWVST
eukprot:2873537-Alexandrium_andersonii.AAC.1